MSKLVASIKEAIEKCELRDGMTISFHHHMRNGDYVLNMVLDEIAKMGIKNLTVNASSIFDVHEPIIGHIKNGVVTGIECNYMGAKVGKAISEGIMDKQPRRQSLRHGEGNLGHRRGLHRCPNRRRHGQLHR